MKDSNTARSYTYKEVKCGMTVTFVLGTLLGMWIITILVVLFR